MNIIPNLIANGQLIQDNLELNQTFPWIDIDLNFNANQSNCSQDLQRLSRDLRTRKNMGIKK